MEIIAEIGQNHNGDIKLAIDLIHKAKDCGADVAKFQLYDAKKLFPKQGNEWFEYNCSTEITRTQLDILANECEKIGIEFMSSVFDIERISWLEAIGVKRYKIASRSIYDEELITTIAATGKKIIVSLGHWKESSLPVIKAKGGVDFLYCISKYPTALEDVRLSKVDFTQFSGFSDHTIGTAACIAALARGAKIIEKHFTLDKNLFGPDHICSMDPSELLQITNFRNELAKCL